MGVTAKKQWITGEEIGRERRRLIESGVPDDSPEFAELWARVEERDEALWEQYGKRYMESDPGKWIAISLDGQVLIRETASELVSASDRAFGAGNYGSRKLAEFPGHRFHA